MMKFTESSTDTVLITGDLTVGVDDTGNDVRIYSATASEGIFYDASEDELGLLLTTKLKFHDIVGREEIYASSNGHLEINAGTTLDITAPTVDINAATLIQVDGEVAVGVHPDERLVRTAKAVPGTPLPGGGHVPGDDTFRRLGPALRLHGTNLLVPGRIQPVHRPGLPPARRAGGWRR